MRCRWPALLLCIVSLCLAVLGGLSAAEQDSPSQPSASVAATEAAGTEVSQPQPAPAPPQPAPAPIVAVEVVGCKNIPEDEVRTAIRSKAGSPYSEEQVSRDRQAVLNLGWFKTVAVERESVEDGVRLVFRVSENELIKDVQFQGIRVLTREELLAVMETQPNTVYNTFRLARDAQAIEELYRKKGYILAIVLGPLRMTPEGVLSLVIAEGEIEAIRITGNTYTKEYVIRRYLRTMPGEVYNGRQVSEDITRLSNTGFFETVRQDAEVGTEPGKVILIITVVERKQTGQASIAGAYSSTQGLIGMVDVTKTNLRGSGQTVSVRGEWGGRKSWELGYRNPWIMTPETRLSLGIYDRLILREAFVQTEGDDRRSLLYDERRSGGNLTLGRPLSPRTTLYLGLRRDDVSLSAYSEEDEPYLTGAAFTPREVRSLTLAAVNDTRDNLFNPHRGSYHQLSLEFAGMFGGSDFSKYSMDTRRYLPAGGKKVVAMRLLVGTTSGDAPYLEQFLIGGPESLRGYRTDRFPGSHMAILNTELRVPISENLTGVAFADVGDAWGGAIAEDPFFRGDTSFSAHLGYGAGVRVNTPLGPVRLDLGFSEEGTETHFGFHHMF